MILIFGKGRRTFDISGIEHAERVRGENGGWWVAYFKPGEKVGSGIELSKYDFAYVIKNSGQIHWYKGAPMPELDKPGYLVTSKLFINRKKYGYV